MKKLKLPSSKENQPCNIKPNGINIVYYKNPVMVAWWSASFPGFGHILLGQYIKGLVLFLWEMVINLNSHLNNGLVATLQGNFDKTKDILNPIWILLYIPIFLFSIWDSYQTAMDINKAIDYPEKGFRPFKTFVFNTTGVNAFTHKNPVMALFWSLFSPGAGQFYLQRLVEAFFFMFWFIIICYYSHFFESLLYLLIGKLSLANQVLNVEWFMYLPSIFCFSSYNAYGDAVETNLIYRMNQTQLLQENYQHPSFQVQFPER